MITRRFGRTNLQIPVFSCGGMRYQQSWNDEPWEKIDPKNQENLEATIHRALELGINHIETARGYGSSELQLGRILPSLPRESLILQTKVAPAAGPGEFTETFATSMQRLCMDHVDLLSLHGINNRELLELSLQPGGSLDQARKLQKEGRCRFIGFSTHAPLDVIMDAIRTGEFDYVNLHWYWINQDNWPAIVEARRRDMGVFIISPNDKGGKLYEAPKKLVQLCKPFSPMTFNDLFCLSRPEVHTLSIGASRPTDFDEHLKILPLLDRAKDVISPTLLLLHDEKNSILGKPWCDSWRDGLPEWEKAPGEINVREIVRMWNLDTAFDMREYAIMRYNLLGQGGHWFPGKNAAELDESAMRAAIEGHVDADRVIRALREAHERFQTAPKKRLSQE